MGISVILGIVGGLYIDDYYETAPLFFWLGFGLGMGAAANTLIRIAKKTKRELATDDDPKPPKKN